MQIRTLFVSLVLNLLLASSATAQYVHPIYQDSDSIIAKDENTLYFRLQNVNYFKNNEYFGEIIPGYTLPGFDLTPLLVYHPTKNTKLEAGYQLKLRLGEFDDMERVTFLRFHWMIRDWASMVLGTLYSHNSHGLPEPLMNPELSFHSRRDQGLQFLFDRKYWEADAWVSWDEFIWFGDRKNERVWGGLSAKLKFGNKDNRFEIPLYVTADHSGGQIDATWNPATTELNIGSGLRYKRQIGGFVKQIEVSSEVFGYANDLPQEQDIFRVRRLMHTGAFIPINEDRYTIEVETTRPVSRTILDQGYGSLSRLVVDMKYWKASLGYWYGYNFDSPRGEYVYHSKSPFTRQIMSKRQLAHLHGSYRRNIAKGMKVVLALDTYYLIEEATTDLGMGVYLYFNRDFFLGKFKGTN